MTILGIIASASAPRSVVTGGTLTSDATYFYRTFTSSGTLDVANLALLADYFVVGGGGGWGDPAARPLHAIARDIRLGYVSAEAAARDYGSRAS